MRKFQFIAIIMIAFLFGVAFGEWNCNSNEKALAEQHYQQACCLSDIVHYCIDNGDTIAEELYADLKYNIEEYNVNFDGESIDSLYWWY